MKRKSSNNNISLVNMFAASMNEIGNQWSNAGNYSIQALKDHDFGLDEIRKMLTPWKDASRSLKI